MWHLMQSCPMLAQLLPDIHFLLHFGHLYSPKHLFFPWYGVSPSPLGRAYKQKQSNYRNDWNCGAGTHPVRTAKSEREAQSFGQYSAPMFAHAIALHF